MAPASSDAARSTIGAQAGSHSTSCALSRPAASCRPRPDASSSAGGLPVTIALPRARPGLAVDHQTVRDAGRDGHVEEARAAAAGAEAGLGQRRRADVGLDGARHRERVGEMPVAPVDRVRAGGTAGEVTSSQTPRPMRLGRRRSAAHAPARPAPRRRRAPGSVGHIRRSVTSPVGDIDDAGGQLRAADVDAERPSRVGGCHAEHRAHRRGAVVAVLVARAGRQ